MLRTIVVTVTLLSGGLLFGQSAFDAIRIVQDEIGFGTRALAMGGAYTAAANDYSAIYWNPAGLTDVSRGQVFGELSNLTFANSAAFKGTLTEESDNYTNLRALGFAFPLPTRRGSFVIAGGYQRVRDFDQNLLFSGFNNQSNGLSFDIDDTAYDFDRGVYQSQQVTDEGGLEQVSLGFGVALSPNVTAGLTANIWTGEDDYQWTFRQEDREFMYEDFPANFDTYVRSRTILSDYSAFGLKAGATFDLGGGVKLGGAVGLPVTFTVEEDFSENDRLTFDDGFEDTFDYPGGVFEYKVKTPFHFDFGASFNSDVLTLAASARYRDWSQTRFDVPDGFLENDDYVDLIEENVVLRNDFEATLQYNLGGEVYLDHLDTKLRGGYAVHPSPVKNAPSDRDRTYITAGLGFKLDRYVDLDLAYMRGSWSQVTEDAYTPGGTEEEITTHRVLVGLTYRF